MKKFVILLLLFSLVACKETPLKENNSLNEVIRDHQEQAIKDEETILEEIQLRPAIRQEDFLKTSGKNIVNKKDQLVQLKGVNIGAYLLQELWMTPTRDSQNVHAELDLYKYLSNQYGDARRDDLIAIYQDHYFTEADFNNLHELGVNLVRLPFWYRNIVTDQGELIDHWYDRFDWFIEEAGRRGIYVILDFHGAPGSQNASDHSGIDGGDHKEAASEFFFGSEAECNQALYYKIWQAIAERYKDHPVLAGYDLLNEPYCTYRYNSTVSVNDLHQNLWTIYDEAYKKIRAIDPDHIIIMEATWDPIDLPDPKDYEWTNIMYEYHNYLYDDYQNEDGKQILNMQKKINLIKAANYNLPSYMGEFSYFDSYEAWDEGLDLLTSAGFHWTSWTYKTTSNYGNWGLYHHTGGDISVESVDDEKLQIIWSKVGDSRPNKRLIEVMKPYFKKAYQAYE